ncbi:MAG: ferredoxin [Armatimonadetes bacterium]|nr:ferredoxin [Armatimonadota bacterium]
MAVRLNPEKAAVMQVAELMCVAARTAPKARGADNLVTAILADHEEKEILAAAMRAFAEEINAPFFARDAQNLLDADACVLIGTRLQRLGIPGCNLCGFEGCQANEAARARCAYNAGDLGIALGSAVSVAANHRVDCRIMYTVGLMAVRLGLLGEEVGIAHGIPLSVTGKSIFFDRK